MTSVKKYGEPSPAYRTFLHFEKDKMLNDVQKCSDYNFSSVRNVGGTSEDEHKKYRNSWIQHYKKQLHDKLGYPQDMSYKCSFSECGAEGIHGAHVVFDNGSGLYLVPMCQHHNPSHGCVVSGEVFKFKHGYRTTNAEYAVKLYDLTRPSALGQAVSVEFNLPLPL